MPRSQYPDRVVLENVTLIDPELITPVERYGKKRYVAKVTDVDIFDLVALDEVASEVAAGHPYEPTFYRSGGFYVGNPHFRKPILLDRSNDLLEDASQVYSGTKADVVVKLTYWEMGDGRSGVSLSAVLYRFRGAGALRPSVPGSSPEEDW